MRPAIETPSAVTHNAPDQSVEEPPPSSVAPAFQIAAVASLAGLRDSCGNVPLDSCVLVRTANDVRTPLDARAERVLLHVDGVLSLQEIAEKTNLSLPDTIEAYLTLLALGIVAANVADTDVMDTDVSGTIGTLARLSDVTTIPQLAAPVRWKELDAPEAWLVSLVSAGLSVEAIVATSPLGEEEALRLLAKLVVSRVITVAP